MIVVTGATGFVGRQLLPRLRQSDDVLIVSRDPEAARCRFPGVDACDYVALGSRDVKGAVFLHLAARNNDRPGTLEQFRSGNVACLRDVVAIAKQGGASRLINLCTTHAIEPASGDLYGLTKREGAEAAAALWPDGVTNLYVPAVYGERFQGRLSVLSWLPAVVRPIALAMLRQAKPIISIDNLWQAIARPRLAGDMADPWSTEQYVADPVGGTSLYSAFKRTLDMLAALAVIVLLGWLMVLVALWVRIDSPGPAVFAQKRVGRDGRVFTCFKFRTMSVGTAHAATHEVSASAVTRAGAFLRRTKLDELPQIFNVLMNQMSLVGPRPCLPMQADLVMRRDQRGVLGIKPGITGLAQIRNIDMSDPARLASFDDRYRAFRTTLGDLTILLRTAIGGGSGDRVAGVPVPPGVV